MTSGARAPKAATSFDTTPLDLGRWSQYRYQCPHDDCDAHLGGMYSRSGSPQEKTWQGEDRKDPEAPFYCKNGCKRALRRLYDKKEDEIVELPSVSDSTTTF